MNSELKYWIWLAQRAGRANKKIRSLFFKTENPGQIYKMSATELRNCGLLDERSAAKLSDKSLDDAEKIISDCIEKGCNIITYDSPEYPYRLKEIEGFPYVLYHRGKHFDFKNSFAIGIVGTRKASKYGYEAATTIASELAYNKALIISGMALGIDGAAQRAAMRAGYPVVSVLGSGIDIPSPVLNEDIYEYCVKNGAVYSEYPPGTPGLRQNYPARNRIISGLSVGVVVIEAGEKSGSLITAKYALDQNRDVFAVPGMITSANGMGTNKLLKERAYIVTSVEDILDEYRGMFVDEEEIKSYSSYRRSSEYEMEGFLASFDNLTPLEKEISEMLIPLPQSADALSEKMGVPVSKILATLTLLEIKGAVKTAPGNKFALKVEREG